MTGQSNNRPESSRAGKVGILGLGKVLLKVTSIVSAALLARILTKVDYAAYRQTLLAYHFVEPLLILGLTSALLYFIPRNRVNGRRMLTGNLLMLFILGCVFAAAIWLGGNELLARRFSNPALKRLLLIYSPYIVLALPIGTISAALIACDRVKTLTIYNVASHLFSFACVLIAVLYFRTVEAAIIGVVVGGVIVFFPGIILMYRATRPGPWQPDPPNMWAQLKYSVPLGLASILGVVSLNLDKVLVSSICSPEDFAIYVNGAMEIPLVGVVTGSVMSILLPEFAGLFKDGEVSRLIELWKSAMIKCALVFFPLMVILMILAPELMRVLFGVRYNDSAAPFRIYLLILPIRITQFAPILMAAGKNHLVLLHTVVSLVLNLGLSIALIKILGYLGAALATVIVLYLWSVPFFSVVIGRISGFSLAGLIPGRTLGSIALCSFFPGLFCYGLRRVLPVTSDLYRFIIIGGIYFLITGFVMYYNGFVKRDLFIKIWNDATIVLLGRNRSK